MSFEAFFATNFLGFKHPRIMIPLAPDCRIAKLKSINIVIIAIIQKDHQLIYIYLPLFKEGFASFFHRKKIIDKSCWRTHSAPRVRGLLYASSSFGTRWFGAWMRRQTLGEWSGEWTVNGAWMGCSGFLHRGSGEWSSQKFPKHNDTRCFVLATRIYGGMTGDKGGFELHQPKTMIYWCNISLTNSNFWLIE